MNNTFSLPKILFGIILPLIAIFASPANACPSHDQLCTHHALGVPWTSYDVNNDETRLVIYSKATYTSHGDEQTDFDNHVLLPTQTTYFDLVGNPTTDTTEPFITSQTSYGRNNDSDITEWNTPDTDGAHVYGSQYQVIFNKNTAQAIHTGDLNGGEEGRTPYQSGCPDYENKANCEAVVITGNVPNGTYSQKVQMFNFFNKDDPDVQLELGAWVTGQGTLISATHLDSTQANVGLLNDTLAQGKESQLHFTNLKGDKAQTQQYDYNFYNRGFDSHAVGVTAWDHNKQYHQSKGGTFEVMNHQKGTIDTKQKIHTRSSTDTTYVGGTGASVTETNYTPWVTRTQTIGSVGCTDGFSIVSCNQRGVVRLNPDGSMSQAGYDLKSQTVTDNIGNAGGSFAKFMSSSPLNKISMLGQASTYLQSEENRNNLLDTTKNTLVTVGEVIEEKRLDEIAKTEDEYIIFKYAFAKYGYPNIKVSVQELIDNPEKTKELVQMEYFGMQKYNLEESLLEEIKIFNQEMAPLTEKVDELMVPFEEILNSNDGEISKVLQLSSQTIDNVGGVINIPVDAVINPIGDYAVHTDLVQSIANSELGQASTVYIQNVGSSYEEACKAEGVGGEACRDITSVLNLFGKAPVIKQMKDGATDAIFSKKPQGSSTSDTLSDNNDINFYTDTGNNKTNSTTSDSKKLENLSDVSKIDFDNHIINGEINSRGKVVGAHSATAGNNVRVDEIIIPPDSNGVYKAKVSIEDPNNPGKYISKNSTMFPDSWNSEKIKLEVEGAFSSKDVFIDNGQEKWRGTTPSGIAVEGYLKPKVTVYPLIENQ